jgi:hypothetical protein
MSDEEKNDSGKLAIQNIMRTEGGREFIWGHLQSCSVFESIFNNDPVQSGYNSGMRDAGLRLEREIKEAAPEYYLKMIKESLDS